MELTGIIYAKLSRLRHRRSFAALQTLLLALLAFVGVLPTQLRAASPVPPYQQATQQPAATRAVGTITAISGSSVTLKTDAGPNITFQVQDETKIVRTEPGQKDLKNATPIHLSDLQVGDRILVLAKPSADGNSLIAGAVVAMKHSDVEAKQEQERQDWQKRGIGGLVGASDPATGTITITAGAGPTKRTIAIHTSSSTVFRRYAPDSVKFDDAKPSSLSEIKPGDQVRARGNRSADGTEFAAEEVVSGAFRNIAGTIDSIDAGAGTITVKDLLSKKPVVVKISADSQVRKLPQPMAMMIAMRLKGGGPNGPAGAGNPSGSGAPQTASPNGGQSGAGGGQARGGMGGRPAGAPDFQQMLSRMPPASISELQKGDAVMIVSTEGTDSGAVTAITLLAGVEPLLEASPSGAQAMMLSPWSLGGGGGGEDTGAAGPQ